MPKKRFLKGYVMSSLWMAFIWHRIRESRLLFTSKNVWHDEIRRIDPKLHLDNVLWSTLFYNN